MIIKKLELQGFKSFPEKTKILFHPGITAVVGPNGTGKSNIVDALLWVLGGKRFRTLRGERSTDIIFNGHESKPPLSMADVNLHLDDGEEEVIINHRYFRSGESEYRLNGRLARLKDIQDLLWKKAIGELRYFVIEQGSIGLFLNAKPVEKRALLEEAAGTAYYKDKKVQAESKLQSSEQNLTRLEDILSEVSREKNSLKRQANAAIRYRKLRDRIRTLTSLHYRKRIEELEREQKEAALRYENILHQENTVLSRIKTQEKSLAAIRKEAWNLEKALKEGTANLYSLKSQFTRLDTEKDEKKRSLSLLEEKKQKAEERIQELTQEQASLEKERTMVLSSLKQQEESLAQKRQDLEQASRTMASFQERKARSRKNLESLRNRYFKSIHLTTEAKNEKARLERELEILLRQEEKLKSQMQREEVHLEESGQRINKRLTEISRIAKTQEKIQKDLESRKKERDDLLSSIHAFQEKIDKLKKTRDREIQHLELLQKIETEERRGGTIESIPGSSGILADLIESDPEYAPLIDILWRDEVKAQLLRPEDFLKSLGEKKREGLFFLLHPEKREKPLSQVDQDPRVLGRLKSHIRAQTKIKEFISSLKEAFLVKDIKSAVELWLKFPSQNYMTAEGHLLLSSGIVMMGGKKEGFFTLVQDIKTLKQSIFSLEKKISPLELEIKNKEERAKALDEDIKRKNESLASLEKEKEEKENEIALDRTGEEKVKLAVSTLQKELRILGGDKGEIQKRLQTVESRLRASEKEETSLREALQTEEKHIETMEKENEEKRKAFFELKSEI
ncbi:MAG: AAA family ATPase, partial [Candidatus Aminicenantales bacterium]